MSFVFSQRATTVACCCPPLLSLSPRLLQRLLHSLPPDCHSPIPGAPRVNIRTRAAHLYASGCASWRQITLASQTNPHAILAMGTHAKLRIRPPTTLSLEQTFRPILIAFLPAWMISLLSHADFVVLFFGPGAQMTHILVTHSASVQCQFPFAQFVNLLLFMAVSPLIHVSFLCSTSRPRIRTLF